MKFSSRLTKPINAFLSLILAAGLLPVLPSAAWANDTDSVRAAIELEAEAGNSVALQSPLLSNLEFKSSSSASGYAFHMTPDFSSDTNSYTVTIPCTIQAVFVTATLAEGIEGAITASYTANSGADRTATLTSGKTAPLPLFIAQANANEKTCVIKVGDEVAANITVVRSLALNSLSLQTSAGEDITLAPGFAKPALTTAGVFAYAAKVIEGESVVVTPTPNVAASTITVNGQPLVNGAATVDPAWAEDGTCTVPVVVSLGNQSTTYTIALTRIASIPFEGTGTAEDPYILATTANMTALSNLVQQQGMTFAEKHFRMTENITLPESWVPLGQMADGKTEPNPNGGTGNPLANIHVFSGSIEGDGHTLTVPKGEKPLFGFVLNASVHNLKIYGEEIAGYGLVNNYHITGTSGKAIAISDVTLLSGTKTLMSGFLGGYTSASYVAEIKDCTIEQGVTIGYDKQQSRIGSFAGSFNGTITNCESYADVYGVDMVGGIAGARANSMSTGTIDGCTFGGSVTGTGSYAGGISGAGYDGLGWGLASAPNGFFSTFTNNTMSGSVAGNARVGGILGGEGAVHQCWDNGAGSISNNVVTGTVEGNSEVGAIIGFLAGLNKYTTVENNSYAYTAAREGIGRVEWVDTECVSPAAVEGTTYLNSGDANTPLPDFRAGTGQWDPKCFSQRNCQRTDDPLGADASKLCRAVSPEFTVGVEEALSFPPPRHDLLPGRHLFLASGV